MGHHIRNQPCPSAILIILRSVLYKIKEQLDDCDVVLNPNLLLMNSFAKLQLVVSVLNWNRAESTLGCLRALRSVIAEAEMTTPGLQVRTIVLDNGSREEQLRHLRVGLQDDNLDKHVELLACEQNLGFAGGHNAVMRRVMNEGADFIWLLNNDALPLAGCLTALLHRARQRPDAGALSPVVMRHGSADKIEFCGSWHEWGQLTAPRAHSIAQAQRAERERPSDCWVSGAAILLRVEALHQVGLLDEAYFAYYEDDDICARLSLAGWRCVMAFDARVEHDSFGGDESLRPAYFFYLMNRNGLRFWSRNTPTARRDALWRLRLVKLGLFEASRWSKLQGENRIKHHASLLGLADGLRGRAGPVPDLSRPVPLWVRTIAALRDRMAS